MKSAKLFIIKKIWHSFSNEIKIIIPTEQISITHAENILTNRVILSQITGMCDIILVFLLMEEQQCWVECTQCITEELYENTNII